jgi:hypothetical protein
MIRYHDSFEHTTPETAEITRRDNTAVPACSKDMLHQRLVLECHNVRSAVIFVFLGWQYTRPVWIIHQRGRKMTRNKYTVNYKTLNRVLLWAGHYRFLTPIRHNQCTLLHLSLTPSLPEYAYYASPCYLTKWTATVIQRAWCASLWSTGGIILTRRNLSQRHFVHHKSQISWPGIEPKALRWKAGN